jgi:phosphatidylglycerophosphatase A
MGVGEVKKNQRGHSPLDCLSVCFATCFFLGFLGPAPGTSGALLGALFYPVTFRFLSPRRFLFIYGLALLAAIAICGRAARVLGRKDPSAVIFDEYIAMPLCYWPLEQIFIPSPVPLWALLLLGFGLFRLFDVRKPFIINSFQLLPGGYGIVFDDLAAALAAALSAAAILLLIRWI